MARAELMVVLPKWSVSLHIRFQREGEKTRGTRRLGRFEGNEKKERKKGDDKMRGKADD
jgi:hypothetical protein